MSDNYGQIGKMLLLLGFGLLVVAGTRPASAAIYNEGWDATGYRTATLRRTTADSFSGDYCLGPSQWAVYGDIDGQAFNEVWSVPVVTTGGSGWIDSQPLVSGHTIQTLYGFSSTCKDGPALDDVSPGDTRLTTIGVYGGMASSRSAGGLDSWNMTYDVTGVRSMPRGWHVEGSIR